jgi:hypothetical protein
VGADVLSTSAAGEEEAGVTISADGELRVDGPSEIMAWRRQGDDWREAIIPRDPEP